MTQFTTPLTTMSTVWFRLVVPLLRVNVRVAIPVELSVQQIAATAVTDPLVQVVMDHAAIMFDFPAVFPVVNNVPPVGQRCSLVFAADLFVEAGAHVLDCARSRHGSHGRERIVGEESNHLIRILTR